METVEDLKMTVTALVERIGKAEGNYAQQEASYRVQITKLVNENNQLRGEIEMLRELTRPADEAHTIEGELVGDDLDDG